MVDSSPCSSRVGTILVVDDEAIVLKMVRAILSSRGHRVITVDRGTKAQHLLETQAVDVLITDLSMPDLHGVDLLTFARRSHPHVRRIAYSGADDVLLAKRCVNDAEVHRYLTKPCTAGELLAAVEDALRRRPTPLPARPMAHDEVPHGGYVLSEQRLQTLCRLFAGTKLQALVALTPRPEAATEDETIDLDEVRADGRGTEEES